MLDQARQPGSNKGCRIYQPSGPHKKTSQGSNKAAGNRSHAVESTLARSPNISQVPSPQEPRSRGAPRQRAPDVDFELKMCWSHLKTFYLFAWCWTDNPSCSFCQKFLNLNDQNLHCIYVCTEIFSRIFFSLEVGKSFLGFVNLRQLHRVA